MRRAALLLALILLAEPAGLAAGARDVSAAVTESTSASSATGTAAASKVTKRILNVPYINQHLGLWVPEQHGYTNAWWANQTFEGSSRIFSYYGCGFACAAMAISYMRGSVINPKEIMTRACGFNGIAADRDVGVRSAAKYGFRAYTLHSPTKQQIINELVAGNPVMVLEQHSKFGGGNGHYVLLIGYWKRDGIDQFAVSDPSNQFMAWVCDQKTHTWEDVNQGAWHIDSELVSGEYTVFCAANKQVEIGGKEYLQSPEGTLLKGFQYLEKQNKTCYYDSTGAMVHGLKKIGKYFYYFDKKTGAMKTNGFQYIAENGKTFYFNSKGRAVSGLKKINGNYYYFRTYNMKKGFVYISEKKRTCYFNSKGQMVFGLHKIKGKYYYFAAKTGAMKKNGFQYIAEKKRTCYFDKKGRMVFGKKKINGKWYNFNKKTGAMIKG